MGNQQNNLKFIEEEFRKNLTTLSLNSIRICETDLNLIDNIIKKSKTLKMLKLNNASIDDQGMLTISEAIKANSNLEGIYLEGNSFSKKGIKCLADGLKINKSIKFIELLNNNIQDEGVKLLISAMMVNDTLQKIGLSDNNISDIGVNHIADIFKTNSSITTISLYGNNITDNGINYLCEGLKNNKTLKKIYLGKNKITEIGAKLLYDLISSDNIALIEIGLADNPIKDKSILEQILQILKREKEPNSRINNNVDSIKLKEKPQLPIHVLKNYYEDTDETPILKYKINLPDIEFKTSPIKGNRVKVGAGGFGSVYLAEFKGKYVAVKMASGNLILQEMKLVFKLNHHNINSPICYAKEGDTYYMLGRYFQEGDLSDILTFQKEKLTIKRKLYIMYQVSNAILYLHEKTPPIMHRDIKPGNILIGYEFKEIALTDFGTAIFTYDDFKNLTEIAGTPNYMAPELFEDKDYDISSDIYSFGMLMYEVFSDTIPFNRYETSAIKNEILRGIRPDISLIKRDTPKEIINIIIRSWDQDAFKRPTMKEINATLKRIS